MESMILGVDPGIKGALAWVNMTGDLYKVEDMPVIDNQVNAPYLARLLRNCELSLAVVEKVHSMPKQGVASTFKFGVGYGIVLGQLAAYDIPVYHMTPHEWKTHMRLGKTKEHSRRMAVDRWPGWVDHFHLAKHEGRAEAALIATAWLEKNRPELTRRRRIIRR
jgi:Holliday junction resolvasome RuvABC endonuclease subunit